MCGSNEALVKLHSFINHGTNFMMHNKLQLCILPLVERGIRDGGGGGGGGGGAEVVEVGKRLETSKRRELGESRRILLQRKMLNCLFNCATGQ